MGYNKQFLTNQALNVSFASAPLQVGQTGLIDTVYSVEAIFGGSTCEFTAKIQVSSESVAPASHTDASWSDLANSSQTITTAGNFIWNVNQVGYTWIQLVVTDGSSGTNNGTLVGILNVNP